MNRKTINISIATFTFLGIICITSGIILPNFARKGENIVTLKVTQKQVASIKTNIIKTKDLVLEINHPISVDIKDYLVEPEKIEDKILKELKLDTSEVNISQAGSYTYTITHKKKKYTGSIIIKEKELPNFDIHLRNLSLAKGTPLATDLATYIIGTIPEEAIHLIKIDLTAVNMNVPSIYQYSVTYKGKMYTGNITIYDPQPKVKTPVTEEEKKTEITPPETQTP